MKASEVKAADLRIGNLVQYQSHSGMQPTTVTSMNEDGIDLFSRDEYPHKIDADLQYKDVHGIPLNEEWLIKLGMNERKHLEDWYVNLKNTGTILIYSPKFNLLSICGVNQKPILYINCEYVHTLQNCFYSLTGEELTIKE